MQMLAATLFQDAADDSSSSFIFDFQDYFLRLFH